MASLFAAVVTGERGCHRADRVPSTIPGGARGSRDDGRQRKAQYRMTRSNLRGVLSMLAAVATFSMMDVALKRLVEIYPVMQVTFLRGAASLPLLIGAAGMFGRWSDLLPKRWTLHVVRGFLSIAVLWCFIYALRLL